MLDRRKKIDSKVRFQRRGFRQQLQAARTYKRTGRPSQQDNLLKQLNGKAVIILLALVLTGAAILYLPSPFAIKKINISGLNNRQTEGVRALVAQYLASQRLPLQASVWFLSKDKLAGFLLEHDRDLLQISAVKTRLPGTLELTIAARQNEYLISSPEGAFTLSNDDIFNALEQSSSTATSTLPKISITDSGVAAAGGHYGNLEQLEAIGLLTQRLPDVLLNATADHYEIQNFKNSDITVYAAGGAKYYFDYKTGLADNLNKLRLLLASIAPKDAARLAYIDMRIKSRSYVCLKGAPCATAPEIVLGTSTPDTVLATSTLEKLP
jgi:cell division septal protein FtsQ